MVLYSLFKRPQAQFLITFSLAKVSDTGIYLFIQVLWFSPILLASSDSFSRLKRIPPRHAAWPAGKHTPEIYTNRYVL